MNMSYTMEELDILDLRVLVAIIFRGRLRLLTTMKRREER
jgi:hypothetical protein